MDMTDSPIISKKLKPRKCQRCGGAVLPIVYGYPARETFKAAARGEIILGGCCIPDDFDKLEDWVCKECGQRYKKQTEEVPTYDEAFGLTADEVGVYDTKVMGVFGAMRRGATKEEALKKYGLTEKEYDDNIDRVLNG